MGWFFSRALYVGGNANNGSNAGLAYSNSNNSPSNTNANIGSRKYLLIKNITEPTERKERPCLLAKNIDIIKKGLVVTPVVWVSEDTYNVSKEMKRIDNLYDKIISLDNLRLADKKARKNKKKQYGVRLHDKHREADILHLHDLLIERRYKTSPYDEFIINEGNTNNKKERDISRLPYFPDRIAHHAIMNVLEKVFISKFTYNTFSCIKGRGIEGCARYTEKLIKRYKGRELFCLKIDIKKFYPSVNHDILKGQLKEILKDEDTLSLLFEIIDSHKGLPIGNYTSQFLANLNLSPLMHKLSEEWHMNAAEYADDIIVLSTKAEELHELFDTKIKPFVEDTLKLKVKDNWQVFPISENRYDKHGRNLDYVGYKFYRNQKLIRKSTKQTYCRFVAKLNKRKDITLKEYKMAIAPWLGWAKHSNSKNLLKKTIKAEFYESILREQTKIA